MLPAWNAIDLSFDTLTPQLLAGPLAPAGLVIQDLWTGRETPAPAGRNLRVALTAGREIACYAAISGPGDEVRAILSACHGIDRDLWLRLRFIALDCELDPRLNVELAFRQLVLLGHDDRVIYTRRSWWEASGLIRPPSSQLWDARYAGPDGIVPPFMPYGGWTEQDLIGTQVLGSAIIGGITVDLDMMEPRGGPEMDTTQTLAARLDLAGAALDNDMEKLVRLLVYFGVLPAGTVALKPQVTP